AMSGTQHKARIARLEAAGPPESYWLPGANQRDPIIAPMAPPALAITGLTKRYGRRTDRPPALDNLSLEIAPGTVYAFLGPNGAGKTTTLKLVLGLLRPDAGSVSLLGGTITDPKIRARLGYLPEEPVLHTFMTVTDLLSFYGALFGYSGAALHDRVTRTLATVGLSDRPNTRLRDLSKGLRQRVLLGQALINDPELILLDEPQSGLDPVGIEDLRKLLGELRAQGKTIVLNSHQLTDVQHIADRVGILREGVLIRDGSLRDLLGVQGQWVVTLTGLTPASADRLVERFAPAAGATTTTLPVSYEIDSNQQLIFRCADETLAQAVMAAAQEAGGRLVGFSEQTASLEETFLKLMREAAAGGPV
ncbi:MAG: ABC transporter ATP-binding protein, partial [bacterium]